MLRAARRGLQIDYEGPSGNTELSMRTGDPSTARFEVFEFDDGRSRPVGVDVRDLERLRRPERSDARSDELVDHRQVADVEAAELAVQRRALVEAHRVDDVLDDLGGDRRTA